MITDLIYRNRQFLIFGVIGLSNTIIHGGALTVMIELVKANLLIGHVFAFAVANLFSYFMNGKFTFHSKPSITNYFRFLTVSLTTLVITLVLAALANLAGFHYLVGFAIIAITTPAFTFVTLKFWAFSKR